MTELEASPFRAEVHMNTYYCGKEVNEKPNKMERNIIGPRFWQQINLKNKNKKERKGLVEEKAYVGEHSQSQRHLGQSRVGTTRLSYAM